MAPAPDHGALEVGDVELAQRLGVGGVGDGGVGEFVGVTLHKERVAVDAQHF